MMIVHQSTRKAADGVVVGGHPAALQIDNVKQQESNATYNEDACCAAPTMV
jgi:hypothetical protein